MTSPRRHVLQVGLTPDISCTLNTSFHGLIAQAFWRCTLVHSAAMTCKDWGHSVVPCCLEQSYLSRILGIA